MRRKLSAISDQQSAIGLTILRYVFVLVCLAVMTTAGRAEPGSTTAEFLLVPVGGRPNAMGGAYTGMAEDAYAMYFNPAGIAVAPHQLAFAHNEYILDLRQEYASYVHPLNVGALGFSVNTFDFGRFDRTIITNTAAPNTPTSFGTSGTFGATSYAISAGYGRQLFLDGLYLGATVKYIRQDIENFDGSTVAADLGAYWRRKDHPFSAGFSVANLGDKIRMKTKHDELPTTFRLGAAYRFFENRFVATADLEKTFRNDEIYYHVGGEYWVAKMLALRVGYNSVDEAGTGLTAGAGIKVDHFALDYAWADQNELKQTHRISLQYDF